MKTIKSPFLYNKLVSAEAIGQAKTINDTYECYICASLYSGTILDSKTDSVSFHKHEAYKCENNIMRPTNVIIIS